MNRDYKLQVIPDDINKTLEEMRQIFTPVEILSRLYGVPEALLWYGYKEESVLFMKILMDLEASELEKIELEIEYAALLRNLSMYKEMFSVINVAISNYKGENNTLEYALLKIRHAEAVAFNGAKQEAIKELDEIFQRRREFNGNYTPKQRCKLGEYKLYPQREIYTIWESFSSDNNIST
jgi:hypothetical protein